MSVGTALLVALAGGIGSVLRFGVDATVSAVALGDRPLGTLTVNVVGSLALGLLGGTALPADLALIVGTGLVGGFTTFSTWMLETVELARLGRRDVAWAIANVVVSVPLGAAAVLLGRTLA